MNKKVLAFVCDGKNFLALRNNPKDPAHGGDFWFTVTGSLKKGETETQAVIREVKEETGMAAKSVNVICVLNCKDDNSHYVTIGLLCKDFEGDAKAIEEDVVEWKWVDPRKLPDMYFPSENVIKNFLEGCFYKY